jgi:Anti-sigma-K factor rskA
VAHIDPDALALLALGEDAAEDVHSHLANCPGCRIELQRLTAVVTAARSDPQPVQLVTPPPGLWARVAAAAGVDPAPEEGPAQATSTVSRLAAASSGLADDPVTVPELAQPRRAVPGAAAGGPPARTADRAWRRRPIMTALAGLAAGLILGAGAAVGIGQVTAGPPAHVVASIPLRSLPQFPQWRSASGTAIMAQGPHGRQLTVALQAPRRPGFYEVWLLARNGVSMISLGDLGPGHTGKFTMPPGVDLGNYSRIDVSLQPFNGSTLHSGTSVVRGLLPA